VSRVDSTHSFGKLSWTESLSHEEAGHTPLLAHPRTRGRFTGRSVSWSWSLGKRNSLCLGSGVVVLHVLLLWQLWQLATATAIRALASVRVVESSAPLFLSGMRCAGAARRAHRIHVHVRASSCSCVMLGGCSLGSCFFPASRARGAVLPGRPRREPACALNIDCMRVCTTHYDTHTHTPYI
jgi:hypothetical protein